MDFLLNIISNYHYSAFEILLGFSSPFLIIYAAIIIRRSRRKDLVKKASDKIIIEKDILGMEKQIVTDSESFSTASDKSNWKYFILAVVIFVAVYLIITEGQTVIRDFVLPHRIFS